jgi:hypothetical protein
MWWQERHLRCLPAEKCRWLRPPRLCLLLSAKGIVQAARPWATRWSVPDYDVAKFWPFPQKVGGNLGSCNKVIMVLRHAEASYVSPADDTENTIISVLSKMTAMPLCLVVVTDQIYWVPIGVFLTNNSYPPHSFHAQACTSSRAATNPYLPHFLYASH